MIRIGAAALERFRKLAEKERSDALVVLQDGIPLLEWQRAGAAERFEAMSVTKSVASLVLGQLIDAGTVGLADRLGRYFPEWRDDPRGDITVRHVLEHTSGLADEPTTRAIYAQEDFVRFALQAKLAHPPGTRFFYSNKASNLVAGIVRKAAGRELGALARSGLFATLGIEDVEWWEDATGHTQVMSGLQIRPGDLAKLGQLVLDEGMWRGRRVLSRTWIESSTRTLRNQDIAGPPHGLFWWLKPKAVETGFDTRGAGVSAIRADGWLGQYLFVFPEERVVVVRMRHAPEDATEKEAGAFSSIEAELDLLVARPPTRAEGLVSVAAAIVKSEARARWRRFRER